MLFNMLNNNFYVSGESIGKSVESNVSLSEGIVASCVRTLLLSKGCNSILYLGGCRWNGKGFQTYICNTDYCNAGSMVAPLSIIVFAIAIILFTTVITLIG